MKIRLKHCPYADYLHRIEKRNYAHTYHYKNIICISKDFLKLPLKHRYGIIYHEIGHLLSLPSTERNADRAVMKRFGVRIKYVSNKYGNRIQTI